MGSTFIKALILNKYHNNHYKLLNESNVEEALILNKYHNNQKQKSYYLIARATR